MKKTILFSLVFIASIAAGCSDDFLERPPLGTLTEGTFPSSSQDAVAATNGIYNTLRIWEFNTGGFPLHDIMSDDSRKGSSPGDGVQISEFNDFSYSATNGNIESWYRTLYLGIRRSHLVLEKVPNITMDVVLQKRLLAEARFLRGYFYSLLVRGFGDVPMITTSIVGSGITKSTAEELYQGVIFPDLEYALVNLPEKSDYATDDLGRATKGTVRGLLARLYLYRNDFVNTEKYALEVINSLQYELESDFANAFSVVAENGTESIFEIGAIPIDDINLGGNQFGNTQGLRGNPNYGWGFNRPGYNWISFMGVSDPRMNASVVFLNETLDGITVKGDDSTPDTTYTDLTKTVILEIEAYNQKSQATGQAIEEGAQIKAAYGYNNRIIRYADVLLMAAEALNENGNPTQALIYLNQIRERARGGDNTLLPDITITDQSQLRQIIYDERRRELFMEGLRFWDLVRTNKAEAVLGPLGFKKNKHEFFPIPQSEVDISEGVIAQNPNWK